MPRQILPDAIPHFEANDALGQIAYEAYCATTGWKSAVSGAPLPPWSVQAAPIRSAWNAAASAVAQRIIVEVVKGVEDAAAQSTAMPPEGT